MLMRSLTLCTVFANWCTAYAIMYIRSLTWVYCINHEVYCRSCDVFQEPHLSELHLPSSVLHILSCTSGVSLGCTVFAIRCRAYCISYHVLKEPHLGVLHLPAGALHLPSSVLQRPSCSSGATLGCTAFASRCTAFTI